MVHLLKGVLYCQDDERLWASLLSLQARVRERAALLLLDLVLDRAGVRLLQKPAGAGGCGRHPVRRA